ncbi:MAG TPA: 3-isopropylmalate dehydratase small subunit [Azospirillum sp.]|nr:3-isopropylmalate dehydratase small subunit [Azospirillum sp.]
MEKFTVLTGIAAPLMRPNIDTDAIIPVAYLITTTRDGMGKGLFSGWRYDRDHRERPDFVLNRAPYRHAGILVAGENFGCGSSREHAVWALKDFGIRCVIAPSFASIFQENCIKNGVAPVVLREDEVRHVAARAEQAPDQPTTVDLADQTVVANDGREFRFTMAPSAREALLLGLDAVGLTLRHEADIAAFQAADRAQRPWVYAV